MPGRPARASAHVSGVGGARRVAARQRARHGRVADSAVEGAVADRLVFAVPVRSGDPHFHFDVGVARWCERRRDAAECRQRFGWAPLAGRRAAIDRFGTSNLPVRQRERRQIGARTAGGNGLERSDPRKDHRAQAANDDSHDSFLSRLDARAR